MQDADDELIEWVRGELWEWEDSDESYDSFARRIVAHINAQVQSPS
jgi:hypothetical protein